MLSVQDVHTYYRDSYILQGATLELKAAQVVALLGRNGVGNKDRGQRNTKRFVSIAPGDKVLTRLGVVKGAGHRYSG